VLGLPATRFAIGSGVNQSIRQGAVLGVALALTLLGGRTAGLTGDAFDPVFVLCVLTACSLPRKPRAANGRQGSDLFASGGRTRTACLCR
jgi:hypothetical protein